MDEDTEKTAKVILAEIASAKGYVKLPQPHELFVSAETILSGMAYLIGPLLDAETSYRQQIATFMEEGDSNAKAVAKAQAKDHYKIFRKLKYVYDLGEAQTQMLKKFHGVLQEDYKRS